MSQGYTNLKVLQTQIEEYGEQLQYITEGFNNCIK